MEFYENLPLLEVEQDDTYIILTFVDEEKNECHDIKWKKQKFDPDEQAYVDDPNKLKQCEEWAEKYLGVTLDNLEDAVGQTHNIYAYETFESLWEADAKFEEDMVGQIINSKFKDVEETSDGIIIRFDYDGATYRSNMKYTVFKAGRYMVSPQKRNNQKNRFEEKFGVPLEQADSLIGKDIMVEVKAMGKNIYCDVKPFPKKKK